MPDRQMPKVASLSVRCGRPNRLDLATLDGVTLQIARLPATPDPRSEPAPRRQRSSSSSRKTRGPRSRRPARSRRRASDRAHHRKADAAPVTARPRSGLSCRRRRARAQPEDRVGRELSRLVEAWFEAARSTNAQAPGPRARAAAGTSSAPLRWSDPDARQASMTAKSARPT